jgi:hypothetical protein
MQKKILTTIAALSLSVVLGEAQSTVTFSAAIGQPNVFWSGGALANHNEVRIGFFNSGFDLAGNLYNLNAMDAAWKLYGTTQITNIMGFSPGSFTGTASKSDASLASVYDGKKIYLWIFKTTDDSAPAVDYGNVLGYGLYSSTSSSWYFPNTSELNLTGTGQITTWDVNQALFGSYDASHLYLNAVPEPSLASLALMSLGALFLAMRRKN